ncbi:MAG: hypothetical protein SGPRY_008005 [Prymnesium sp.]
MLIISLAFSTLLHAPIRMSAPPPLATHEAGVLWDVDGTLVESTQLAFIATNEVLAANGYDEVTVEDYKFGCRFTTPERFNVHIGGVEALGRPEGEKLGQIFDDTYVARVSRSTAGLFPGMERLLRNLAMAGHPQGCLSNACGDYVVAANELDEQPGKRIALFGTVRGADDVPAAKPAPDGLASCCESIGVLWGANSEESLKNDFDVLCKTVDELADAIRDMMLPTT